MPDLDQVKEYIKANDNAADYADKLLSDLDQAALEDIDDLYTNTNNRDEEFWDAFGVDTELVLDDYDAEEIRGIDWTLGLSGIAAASLAQFFVDNRDDTIIRPSAYREQLLAGFDLTRAELILAAQRGYDIQGTAQFERLTRASLNKLSPLKTLSNTELYSKLLDVGAVRPPEQMIVSAQGYVSRMTNYRPGSPQFKEEVSKLISTSSTRGLKSLNRRSVAQISMVAEAGGDIKKPLVWVLESGPGNCSYCIGRAGRVETYEDWVAEGLPGADVCKGGDLCNCQLVAVSNKEE